MMRSLLAARTGSLGMCQRSSLYRAHLKSLDDTNLRGGVTTSLPRSGPSVRPPKRKSLPAPPNKKGILVTHAGRLDGKPANEPVMDTVGRCLLSPHPNAG